MTENNTSRQETTLEQSREFALPIQWWFPPGQRGQFANHMIIQFDNHEFHLSFFEIQPPVLIGSEEDKRQVLESLDHIDAVCVARIVISKDRMPVFVKAISEHVARHIGKEQE